MIAATLAFIAGLFMIPWVIAFFILFALIAEYREASGWGITYLTVAVIGLLLIFTPSPVLFWTGVGLYIPVGLVWAVFRYRRWANGQVKKFNEEYPADVPTKILPSGWSNRDYELNCLEKRTDPKQNVKKMVYWTFNWPISMVESALDDLIAAVEDIIVEKMKKIYHKMWRGALAKVEKPAQATDETIEV